MTVPHLTAAVEAPTAAAAARVLKRRGLRLSASRRLVLEALFAAGAPLSAEDIARGVAGLPPTDLGSVYRNLETLEQLGLVRHVHLGHGAGLYAPAQAQLELVVCERCGSHAPLPEAAAELIRRTVLAAVGYRARFSHQPLPGLCQACLVRDEQRHAH